jgi:hypothetical protein
MKTTLFSVCLLMTPGLSAIAQTTFVLTGPTNKCQSPTGCTQEPFVSPQPAPLYHPWAYATYTTGLPVSAVYPPGGQPSAPVGGTGKATIAWSDGGPNQGTITLQTFHCEMTGSRPDYTITCDGEDSQGNIVHLAHKLYLFQVRYGYWDWADLGGTMTLTLKLTAGS